MSLPDEWYRSNRAWFRVSHVEVLIASRPQPSYRETLLVRVYVDGQHKPDLDHDHPAVEPTIEAAYMNAVGECAVEGFQGIVKMARAAGRADREVLRMLSALLQVQEVHPSFGGEPGTATLDGKVYAVVLDGPFGAPTFMVPRDGGGGMTNGLDGLDGYPFPMHLSATRKRRAQAVIAAKRGDCRLARVALAVAKKHLERMHNHPGSEPRTPAAIRGMKAEVAEVNAATKFIEERCRPQRSGVDWEFWDRGPNGRG